MMRSAWRRAAARPRPSSTLRSTNQAAALNIGPAILAETASYGQVAVARATLAEGAAYLPPKLKHPREGPSLGAPMAAATSKKKKTPAHPAPHKKTDSRPSAKEAKGAARPAAKPAAAPARPP